MNEYKIRLDILSFTGNPNEICFGMWTPNLPTKPEVISAVSNQRTADIIALPSNKTIKDI